MITSWKRAVTSSALGLMLVLGAAACGETAPDSEEPTVTPTESPTTPDPNPPNDGKTPKPDPSEPTIPREPPTTEDNQELPKQEEPDPQESTEPQFVSSKYAEIELPSGYESRESNTVPIADVWERNDVKVMLVDVPAALSHDEPLDSLIRQAALQFSPELANDIKSYPMSIEHSKDARNLTVEEDGIYLDGIIAKDESDHVVILITQSPSKQVYKEQDVKLILQSFAFKNTGPN